MLTEVRIFKPVNGVLVKAETIPAEVLIAKLYEGDKIYVKRRAAGWFGSKERINKISGEDQGKPLTIKKQEKN